MRIDWEFSHSRTGIAAQKTGLAKWRCLGTAMRTKIAQKVAETQNPQAQDGKKKLKELVGVREVQQEVKIQTSYFKKGLIASVVGRTNLQKIAKNVMKFMGYAQVNTASSKMTSVWVFWVN